MADIPITNFGRDVVYVGGKSVLPGETRLLPEDLVPGYRVALDGATDSGPPRDPIAEILDGSVRSVVGVLQDLTDEDLRHMGRIEEAGAARKTLIEALGAEQLRRADAAEQETAALAKSAADSSEG